MAVHVAGSSGVRRRLTLVVERNSSRRVWDEVVPVLREHDLDFRVVSVFTDEGTLAEQLRDLDCRFDDLACKSAKGFPGTALKLAKILRQGCDVVQGTEAVPALIGGAAAKLAGRPLSIYHRQHILHEGAPNMHRISLLANRINDVVLACSQASADSAVAEGFAKERTRVAHNGSNELRPVADSELVELRRKLGIAPGDKVISAVCRLRSIKGIDVLIDAAVEVAGQIDQQVHVVIAGDGDERANLENQAKGTPDSVQVHFVGNQFDVSPWYRLGDVVAMPSFIEALGVSAVEAMACQRPLVASAVGGLKEVIVDGESGWLVAPHDSHALAQALLKPLKDEALANTVAAAARLRFEKHFTNRAMVAGWVRCYDEFLAA